MDDVRAIMRQLITGAECKLVAKELLRGSNEELSQQNLAGAAPYALLALMLSTGFTADRASALLQGKAQDEPPFISGDRLTLRSMLPGSAYKPKENASQLVPVVDQFSVGLPPSLTTLLARIRPWLDRQPEGLSIAESLGETIQKVRKETGLHHVSTGRIRRSYAILIHEERQDYCSTATLAQDIFQLSPAPLHYYSAQTDALENLYKRAIWATFGDLPSPSEHGQSLRLGTRALAQPHALKAASRAPSKPLHARTNRDDPASVARTHNALVAHIATMLISIVGHRHSNALFRLSRWDFDLKLAAANIADKISDPAHMRRLVGLGDQVARQISLYLLHLDETCKLKQMQNLRRRASAALTGKQSLFFRLDEETGEPLDADLKWLRGQSEVDIPTNRGRHYLGSIVREWTDNPDLIAIQLGHYESVGYPWSPDSPMVPSQFLQSVNCILDSAFKEQGRAEQKDKGAWRLQAGLASARSEIRSQSPFGQDESWTRTGPISDWHSSMLDFEREARKRNLSVRRTRWFRQHQIQHETEQSVVTIASSLDLPLAELIAHWINKRQRTRRKQDAEFVSVPGTESLDPDSLPDPVTVTDRTIDTLFSEIGDKFTDPEASILAHNTAARALNWACQQKLYRGPIHSPWLPLRPLDISPFIPGLFRATTQVRLLRDHLDQIGRVKSGERDSSAEYCAGVAALWLAVDGGVDHPDLMESLICGDCGIYAIPAVQDAIVVYCRGLKYSYSLQGMAAIAYLKWRERAKGLETLPALEASLDRVLPTSARTARTNLVRALCSTAAMNNRIKRSGMTNLAMDIERGCTSLEEDQLAHILGSDYQAPVEQVIPNPPPDQKVSVRRADNDSAKYNLREEYKQLLHLYHESKDVDLPFSGRTWRYDYANTGPEREKIIEEAKLAASHPGWSWYGQTWALWILQELTRPKLTKPDEKLAYSSVFDRFSEAARRMRDILIRRSDHCLETLPTAEFLEDIYELVLEDAPASTQHRICKTLLSYHEYIATEFDIDDIDPSSYWEYWRPNRKERSAVRSRIPYTEQLNKIETALTRYAEPDSKLEQLGNIDRRMIREALIAFRLAMDSGARIGEIAGLRTVDTILYDDKTSLLIRPNRRRRLKTRSARRVIDISGCISSNFRKLLRQHIEAERDSQPKRKRNQTWLFADIWGRPVPVEKHRIVLNQVAKAITGHLLRLHSLRHREISDQLCQFSLSIGLDELSNPQSTPVMAKLRTPREIANIPAMFGHKHLRTTLESYCHLPWVFQIAEYSAPAARAGELASALAINRSAAYGRLRSRNHSLTEVAAEEINSTLGVKATPLRQLHTTPRVYITAPSQYPRLCLGLHALGQRVASRIVKYRPGLTQTEIDRLRLTDQNLAMRTGIGIMRDNPFATRRHSKPPKWLATTRQLQGFWVKTELDQDPAIIKLADTWQSHAQSGLRHGLHIRREPRAHIVWPSDQVQSLAQLSSAGDLKIETLAKNPHYTAVRIVDRDGRNATSEAVWTLAIAWLVHHTDA